MCVCVLCVRVSRDLISKIVKSFKSIFRAFDTTVYILWVVWHKKSILFTFTFYSLKLSLELCCCCFFCSIAPHVALSARKLCVCVYCIYSFSIDYYGIYVYMRELRHVPFAKNRVTALQRQGSLTSAIKRSAVIVYYIMCLCALWECAVCVKGKYIQ